MTVLLSVAGACIVLLTLADVFLTALFPASGHGPVRKPLEWVVWSLFRLVGRATAGRRRRDLLSYSGPVIIVVTLCGWAVLFVCGWAMIYKPALGTAITASSGPTDTGWATAVYYSGFTFTTLGVGDVAADTALYRMLTIVEAGMGFTFFTMVITYFLSVYSSLLSRNAFAQRLHHLTGGTGDAVELLAGIGDGGDLDTVDRNLLSNAEPLHQIYQTHHFYPVLRYFHYREPRYALPRVLLTLLDATTLMRTVLDGRRYGRALRSLGLSELLAAATALMHELGPGLQGRPPSDEQVRDWRRRYAAAAERLAEVGLEVRADAAAGADEYVALRSEWDAPVRSIAEKMLYEWEAIERELSAGKPPVR